MQPDPRRSRERRRWAIVGALLVIIVMVVAFAPGGLYPLVEGGPGSRAADFVSGRYAKLTVEVDWVVDGTTDYKPSLAVLSWLDQRLEARLSKPGGIQVVHGNAVQAASSAYTLSEIRAAESANRATHTGGDTASIWMFVTNRYLQPSNPGAVVAGVAYSASSVAIFAESISGGSPFPGVNDAVEEITMLHEVGHLLGLVNLGTPMVHPHEDAAHSGHSGNSRSVMYWEVEGPGLASLIAAGNAPDDFDANDIEDLRAIGGK